MVILLKFAVKILFGKISYLVFNLVLNRKSDFLQKSQLIDYQLSFVNLGIPKFPNFKILKLSIN